MIKVLNLYAGLGGNRLKWGGVQVTAIEKDSKIAAVYQGIHPKDTVIVTDAHEYLRENFHLFDFVWASPPCQSHTKFIRSGKNRKPIYPDLRLYEEILFLQHNCKGRYVVENVKPYYKPLIAAQELGRHLFWANFKIKKFHHQQPKGFIYNDSPQAVQNLKNWLGLQFEGNLYYENNHSAAQVLRNCVHPDVGLHIFECAFPTGNVQVSKQSELF